MKIRNIKKKSKIYCIDVHTHIIIHTRNNSGKNSFQKNLLERLFFATEKTGNLDEQNYIFRN